MLKKCFLIAQMNPQIMVMLKSDDDYETDIFKHQGSIISAIVVLEPGKGSNDNDDKRYEDREHHMEA